MNQSQTALLRPEKVQWIFSDMSEHWIDAIPSKSARKMARNFKSIAEAQNLLFTWEKMNEDEYFEWLPYYSRLMQEQNHDIFATKEWFSQKMQEHKTVHWLRCTQVDTGRMLGSAVAVQTPQNTWVLAYKATERADVGGRSNASLGLLVDISFLIHAFEQNASLITAGRSRNAFGYFNTEGYLLSKLRMGFIPVPAPGSDLSETFPSDDVVPTLWLVQENEKQKPFFLLSHPLSSYSQELLHFLDISRIECTERTI